MNRQFVECGAPPVDLGKVELEPVEMMFYLYMPILLPFGLVSVPARLKWTMPLVRAVIQDCEWKNIKQRYVYLTAKTMPVSPEAPGNRPGWHIDGFGSNGDLNYVWANMNPTDFAVQEFKDIPNHDIDSMKEITKQIDKMKGTNFPDQHLLRLDETVVHRVSPYVQSGIRTFVKITVSDHQFRNEGNSRNYLLDYDWKMKPRGAERNLDHA